MRPTRNLLFLAALVLWLPTAAHALPLVAGFGDSITSTTFDPFPGGSYLLKLGPGYAIEDQGVPANLSYVVRNRLQTWLGLGNTADAVVLLTGTPDAGVIPGHSATYPAWDQTQTLGYVSAMLALLAGAGIPAILVAPPPVIFPCDNVTFDGGPDCATFDARLAGLSTALGTLAASFTVPFVDAYALFQAYGGPLSDLLRPDGVHPKVLGDQIIADAIRPILESIIPIPEPSTALLVAAGVVALGARRVRRS